MKRLFISILALLVCVKPASADTPPSADFDRDGTVGIPDFLLFIDVFGTKEGEEKYEAKYDLDGNGEIGIPDFLIFIDNFGKEVNRVPIFTSASTFSVLEKYKDSRHGYHQR